jgi:hypothetical protein
MCLKDEDSLQAPKLQWRVILWSGPEDPNLDVSGDDIQLIPVIPADFVVVFDSAITTSQKIMHILLCLDKILWQSDS